MADARHDRNIFLVEPIRRGVIPLDGLIISTRLARSTRSNRFEVGIDRDFEGVINGCAAPSPGRAETWINHTIQDLCLQLFNRGFAHSVEVRRDGRLVGGLYGVALGRAFFGESMFSTTRDASKIALIHLVARLRAGGFELLDTQFVTDHLARLGAVEIGKEDYRRRLDQALAGVANFHALPPQLTGAEAIHVSSQAS